MAVEVKRISVAGRSELTPVAPTEGIERLMAFETDRAIVVRARVEGGVESGWHHHGDRDVFGFLLAGNARFEYGPDGESVQMSAGDFMHVPAGLVHRDINPEPATVQEFVLVFAGGGPLVVNVEGPS